MKVQLLVCAMAMGGGGCRGAPTDASQRETIQTDRSIQQVLDAEHEIRWRALGNSYTMQSDHRFRSRANSESGDIIEGTWTILDPARGLVQVIGMWRRMNAMGRPSYRKMTFFVRPPLLREAPTSHQYQLQFEPGSTVEITEQEYRQNQRD